MAKIVVSLEGEPEEVSSLLAGGDGLKNLCRDAVDTFDRYLRLAVKGDYADGLVRVEKYAIEGYLYQSLRGHIVPEEIESYIPEEGPDGTP